MAKRRLTPFARFLIFLIIFAPLAYFGAAYVRGEDPIQTIKEWVNPAQQEQSVQQNQNSNNNSNTPPPSNNNNEAKENNSNAPSVESRLNYLEQRMERLEKETKELKERLAKQNSNQ